MSIQEIELTNTQKIGLNADFRAVYMADNPKIWDKEDIKAAIRKRVKSLAALSLKWGFSESAISKALTTPCPNVEKRIARFLGVDRRELWPDRYDAKGNSIRVQHAPKQDTAPANTRNNQYEEAA